MIEWVSLIHPPYARAGEEEKPHVPSQVMILLGWLLGCVGGVLVGVGTCARHRTSGCGPREEQFTRLHAALRTRRPTRNMPLPRRGVHTPTTLRITAVVASWAMHALLRNLRELGYTNMHTHTCGISSESPGRVTHMFIYMSCQSPRPWRGTDGERHTHVHGIGLGYADLRAKRLFPCHC